MSVMYELFALETNTSFSGTLTYVYNSANPLVDQAMSMTGSNDFLTGSWIGNGNTWGPSTEVITALAGNENFMTGAWSGADQPYSTWGLFSPVTESIQRFETIENGTPVIDQGVGPGAWNTFPTPVIVPTPVLPSRDLTRYKKSYSSQRLQPNRIRLVRN